MPAFMVGASLIGYPLARLAGSAALLYRVGRLGIRFGLFLAGTKVVVHGLDKLKDPRNVVVMANHQSMLDPPVLFQALGIDFKAVLKVEIYRVPFLHYPLNYAGYVAIDRKNRIQAQQAIQRTASALKQGSTFLIFPEGTRSRTGELQPFKRGAFVAAIEARSRIFPLALRGFRELLPRGGFRIRPGTVEIEVLDPVDAGGYSYERRGELVERVRGCIEDALRREPLATHMQTDAHGT
jgi:1-acyl-sn-glycerol-3-phosphate acyltransferase